MQYTSMEMEIERRKKDYYNTLMTAQQHRGTDKEIIGEWMLFFFEMLAASIEQLEVRYNAIKSKPSYLNDRQKELMAWITNNEPVKISDLVAAMPQYTRPTLKNDLKYFVKEGLLRSIGKARGTMYITTATQ